MIGGDRPDLLAYLNRYARARHLGFRRLERWRRRERSFSSIAADAEALGAELAGAGIGASDRVGLYLKDGPLWVAGFFGVLRTGAVVVPIDVSYSAETMRRLAGDLELRAWVTEPEVGCVGLDSALPVFLMDWRSRGSVASGLDPGSGSRSEVLVTVPELDPDRPAELVLTSGTSRRPESVMIRHRNLRVILDTLASEIHKYRWAIRCSPRLRIALALPLSHLYGQVMGVFLPPLLDAHVATIETMSAKHLAAALRREGAWVCATVPNTLARLADYLREQGESRWGREGMERRLRRAGDLPWPRRWVLFDPLRRLVGRRLIAVVSGGASLDPEVERFWRRLGFLVIQGYGLTEAAPLVTLNHPLRTAAGSIGRPLPGVEVCLSEEDEILVRGDNVVDPGPSGARVDDAGWLHTGDLGRRETDGRITFVGRKGDRIVTAAGVNVDVGDVATELRREQAIVDAVVVEQPGAGPGVLCAVIHARPGADVEGAVRSANHRLGDAEKIRSWYLWPGGDLPRTPTGKARSGPIVRWLQGCAGMGKGEEAGKAAQASGGGVGEPAAILADDPLRATIAALLSRGVDAESGTRSPVPPDQLLGDVLSSLERVELTARLEQDYGISLSDAAVAGERTIREISREMSLHVAASRGGLATTVGAAVSESQTAPEKAIAPERAAPPPAIWRFWPPTRSARFLLRELVMQALARMVLRIEVEGLARVRSLAPPFLLVANHVSMLDPVLILAMPMRLRGRVAPATRWDYFTGRRAGGVLYRLAVLGFNIVPLVRAGDWRSSLHIAGRLADRGYCPLVYPEGRRSRDGELQRFQPGVVLMSRELHLPIVPCATAGLHGVLAPGQWWPRRRGLRRPKIAICFGEPFDAVRAGDDLDGRLVDVKYRVAELHRAARASFERC